MASNRNKGQHSRIKRKHRVPKSVVLHAVPKQDTLEDAIKWLGTSRRGDVYEKSTGDTPIVIDAEDENLMLACCDCGLVHLVDFKITDGRVKMLFTRVAKATDKLRRRDWANLQKKGNKQSLKMVKRGG